jgi:hypothetical protein
VSAINSNVKALNNARSVPDWTRTSSNTPLERAAPQQPASAPVLTQHTPCNAQHTPLPPAAPAAPAASQPQQPQVLSLLALVVQKYKY